MKTFRIWSTKWLRLRQITNVALTGSLVTAWLVASAQVTPLSFPPSGIGPLTFDMLPQLTDGFSSRSVPGGGGDATAGCGATNTTCPSGSIDAIVQTNSAALFTAVLGTDANPNPPEGSGSTVAAFRWNSARHFLERRPNGNTCAMLLLALRNDSGGDKNSVLIDYDFGIDNNGLTVLEESGLYGYRVYYSLTVNSNSWVH